MDRAVNREMGNVPLLRAVPAPERAGLLPGARLIRLGRNEALFEEGSQGVSFSFTVRGWIKLHKAHRTGRAVAVCLVGPGRLICGNAVYASAPFCCSARSAMAGTEVLSVSRYDLVDLVYRIPAVTRLLLDELTCRGMHLCRRIEEVTSGKVEQRLAALFLRLLREARGATGTAMATPELSLSLSRQELAELCGTTVETTIRTMRRLDTERILRTTERGFAVMDLDALTRLAGG